MLLTRPQDDRGSMRSLLTRLAPAEPVRVEPPRSAAPDVTVRTSRMILRPLTPADWPEFSRVLRTSREHLAHSFPLSSPGEPDAAAFERHLRLSSFTGAGAPDCRRVAFTPDGRLVGGFNLNAISRGLEFRAEAAWWVAREFCGRGLATEGVRAMLSLAFRDITRGGLGLHRVDALVCTENAPSRRIVAKLGFAPPRRPIRVSLDVGGHWRLHELFTRYVAPSVQIEGKSLPATVLRRVDALVPVLEQADPGMMARAASA